MTTKAQRRQRDRLLDQQNGLCGICWLPISDQAKASKNYEREHILPKVWYRDLSMEGKDDVSNLQAAHKACGQMKDREWLPWNRHLLAAVTSFGEMPGPDTSASLIPYLAVYRSEQYLISPPTMEDPGFRQWLDTEPRRSWRTNSYRAWNDQAEFMYRRAIDHYVARQPVHDLTGIQPMSWETWEATVELSPGLDGFVMSRIPGTTRKGP
ncbi:MAG: HNH endonuclease [Gammaproteobacteria bacterium]|nr:HNH endonuclease [Gammaproteobacteria bacterium]MCY3649305.1 HNH endonuclease [Acidimicrobiaceae bacterium]MDE0517187.1 HNH endonuclease [Acidimicrobiaceae bacterium]MDE0657324.1 HNH endonuclease [Acidimicrobiaceae bacterium]MXZ96781.1 HNH endonuclease [Acidimicrobiaceae bacterium]